MTLGQNGQAKNETFVRRGGDHAHVLGRRMGYPRSTSPGEAPEPGRIEHRYDWSVCGDDTCGCKAVERYCSVLKRALVDAGDQRVRA
jgi:hypothetical protein